jgi:hypothetical protein
MSTGPRTVADASTPDAPGTDLTGRVLGDDYRILRKLGQGGMGQVYLAEQVSLGRKVALKVLHPEMASSPQAMQRFEAEARNVARATHANIVQVYDFKAAPPLPYIVLEYVEGRNLKDFVARKGPPDVLLALSLIRQVASALQRAAELGLVHRDIKPENILLTRKGEVKVADFGLSRCLEGEGSALNLTQTGVTMGTPLYMSPEQVQGQAVDSRTDIYSFGVTCYHMLAGHPPFRGESAFEVAVAHVTKQPVPLGTIRPDLPEALCAIVHKMMAKSPDARYQTGRDLLRDVVKLRDGLSGQTMHLGRPAGAPVTPGAVAPVVDGAPTEVEPLPRRRWGHGRVVAVVALTLLAALTAGAAFAWRERRTGGPMGGKDVRAADAGTLETLPLPGKQEQALRDAAEQYLNPPAGKGHDLAGAFVVMDLGLLYLEKDRLNEADRLFTRLAAFQEPKSYRMLGQLGQAIVLGLRNKPTESNALLRELFHPRGWVEGKAKKAPQNIQYKRAVERQIEPIKPVLDKPRWQYWLNRARWYNQHNGLPTANVPLYLTITYPLNERAPAPRGK